MRLSIIIPFHGRLDHLRQCLSGLSPFPPDVEVIVVADGAVDDCRALADSAGATVLELATQSGPATARNRGAAAATGEILVFVDADVVASPGGLARVRHVFSSQPDIASVFGGYDRHPAEQNLVSQYKNLAHSFIHEVSDATARTFWAGFGAIRSTTFFELGGFDERYRRPCVEDIDLGYRMESAGHKVLLDHGLHVCHLKRWSFRSVVSSDIFDRGIPWTQLILRYGRAHNDLNLRTAYRVSVILSYASLLFAAAAFWNPRAIVAALVTAGLVVFLNRQILGYFVRHRGVGFMLAILPLHGLYHLYNGFSFVVGSTLHLASRWFGIRLPGAAPITAWGRHLMPDSTGQTTQSHIPRKA